MHISSREFNQRTSAILKMAQQAPVIITHRGKPQYVTMTYEQYQQMAGKPFRSALDAFLQADFPAEVGDIELDIPPRSTAQRPPVDFGE